MDFSAIIMAAGQGVRMHSELPKVLHPIGGVSLLKRIVHTVKSLNPKQIVIVHGPNGQLLKDEFSKDKFSKDECNNEEFSFALQSKACGTGHAALQGLNALRDALTNAQKTAQTKDQQILILNGDTPLLQPETIQLLLKNTPANSLGLLTISMQDPTGLGRILRDNNKNVLGIVEEKDANALQQNIKEINVGVYVCSYSLLQKWLPALTTDNAQQEYYLTDIIKMAIADKIPITTLAVQNLYEAQGINNKQQLAELERLYQKEQVAKLLKQGVTVLDPLRLDIRGADGLMPMLNIGKDVSIDINVILEGTNTIGNQVVIGPNVILKNSIIQDNVTIKANSIIEGAHIGANAIVGPFARIRPGTVLHEEAHIGNFVEIKNTTVGKKSKANHLSYLGDAKIGQEVNIGAGTITCNYDGVNKHVTIIEDSVSIGSDTQLIAPITIGKGATIGAGTTVIKDIPPGHLAHNRIEHRLVADWVSTKNKKEEA